MVFRRALCKCYALDTLMLIKPVESALSERGQCSDQSCKRLWRAHQICNNGTALLKVSLRHLCASMLVMNDYIRFFVD